MLVSYVLFCFLSACVGFVNDPSIRYYTVLEVDKWDVDYVREGSFPCWGVVLQLWRARYEFSLRVGRIGC